jgi:hypothetical protein
MKWPVNSENSRSPNYFHGKAMKAKAEERFADG